MEDTVTDYFKRYHESQYAAQVEVNAGPGSCRCCPDGGPFAGRPAPKVIVPNQTSRLDEREITDPELLARLKEVGG